MSQEQSQNENPPPIHEVEENEELGSASNQVDQPNMEGEEQEEEEPENNEMQSEKSEEGAKEEGNEQAEEEEEGGQMGANNQNQQRPKTIESYANLLQIKMKEKNQLIESMGKELGAKKWELSRSLQKNGELEVQLNSQKGKISQLQNKLLLSEKSSEFRKKKVDQLKSQLEKYKEIGDIGKLLQKIEQLQLLVSMQKKQLSILSSATPHISPSEITIQHLQKLQSLQEENMSLNQQVSELKGKLEKVETENDENNKILSELDNKIKEYSEQNEEQGKDIECLTQENGKLEKILLQERKKHAQTVAKYEQSNNTEEMFEELKKEKDILFRQYTKLEIRQTCLREELKAYKKQFHDLKKQIKIMEGEKVSRQDYQEVLKRYQKTRKCLSKSIQEIKQLKSSQRIESIEQEKNQIEEEHEEKQNAVEYLQSLKNHIEECLPSFKASMEAVEVNQIMDLKKEVRQQKMKILKLQRELQKQTKQISFYEGQMNCKNFIIENLTKTNAQLKEKNTQMKNQREVLSKMALENIKLKGKASRLENGTVGLIESKRKLEEEKQNWREMFMEIKLKFQQFINKSKENELNNEIMEEEKRAEEPKDKGEMANEDEVREEKSYVDCDMQTEGLSQFYYKEIKQILLILKKFPQKTEKLKEELEEERSKLAEGKKKYDSILDKYNLKFRQLKNEKNENETWRESQKEQITEQLKKQFKDKYETIADLIEDGHLINGLRKAKYLIEQLEQAQGEEVQENL